MKKLVEFPLEDGSSIIVEVDEKPHDEYDGIRGETNNRVVERAEKTLEAAIDQVKNSADMIIKRMVNLTEKPDEIEIEFGLKLSTQLGAVIASGTVEANYVIKLKWSSKKDPEQKK